VRLSVVPNQKNISGDPECRITTLHLLAFVCDHVVHVSCLSNRQRLSVCGYFHPDDLE
jgi:hypothetical protein